MVHFFFAWWQIALNLKFFDYSQIHFRPALMGLNLIVIRLRTKKPFVTKFNLPERKLKRRNRENKSTGEGQGLNNRVMMVS